MTKQRIHMQAPTELQSSIMNDLSTKLMEDLMHRTTEACNLVLAVEPDMGAVTMISSVMMRQAARGVLSLLAAMTLAGHPDTRNLDRVSDRSTDGDDALLFAALLAAGPPSDGTVLRVALDRFRACTGHDYDGGPAYTRMAADLYRDIMRQQEEGTKS